MALWWGRAVQQTPEKRCALFEPFEKTQTKLREFARRRGQRTAQETQRTMLRNRLNYQDGFPTTNVGNDCAKNKRKRQASARPLTSLTFDACCPALRMNAHIFLRTLSECSELVRSPLALIPSKFLTDWASMVLATFAETKVARPPGRNPAISITH